MLNRSVKGGKAEATNDGHSPMPDGSSCLIPFAVNAAFWDSTASLVASISAAALAARRKLGAAGSLQTKASDGRTVWVSSSHCRNDAVAVGGRLATCAGLTNTCGGRCAIRWQGCQARSESETFVFRCLPVAHASCSCAVTSWPSPLLSPITKIEARTSLV